MKTLYAYIEAALLVALLAWVCWEFGGLQRLVKPSVPPATVEQWNRLSDVIEQHKPRAKGARGAIAHPLFVPAPATDRPALIV